MIQFESYIDDRDFKRAAAWAKELMLPIAYACSAWGIKIHSGKSAGVGERERIVESEAIDAESKSEIYPIEDRKELRKKIKTMELLASNKE